MIPKPVFDSRLATCKACEFWQGVCLRGHKLGSTSGCPLRKFEPIQGAAYAQDREPVKTEPARCGACGSAQPTLSWAQVGLNFATALVKWAKEGLPVLSSERHLARYNVCQACPKLVNYQCQECKCVAYVKAKLATESCPLAKWPTSTGQPLSAPDDPYTQ